MNFLLSCLYTPGPHLAHASILRCYYSIWHMSVSEKTLSFNYRKQPFHYILIIIFFFFFLSINFPFSTYQLLVHRISFHSTYVNGISIKKIHTTLSIFTSSLCTVQHPFQQHIHLFANYIINFVINMCDMI